MPTDEQTAQLEKSGKSSQEARKQHPTEELVDRAGKGVKGLAGEMPGRPRVKITGSSNYSDQQQIIKGLQ